jgi:hypothetical protein
MSKQTQTEINWQNFSYGMETNPRTHFHLYNGLRGSKQQRMPVIGQTDTQWHLSSWPSEMMPWNGMTASKELVLANRFINN